MKLSVPVGLAVEMSGSPVSLANHSSTSCQRRLRKSKLTRLLASWAAWLAGSPLFWGAARVVPAAATARTASAPSHRPARRENRGDACIRVPYQGDEDWLD